jgi:hypothetical protein
VKHDCPDDAAAFFATLFLNITYGPMAEPPDGWVECRICGDWYDPKASKEPLPVSAP